MPEFKCPATVAGENVQQPHTLANSSESETIPLIMSIHPRLRMRMWSKCYCADPLEPWILKLRDGAAPCAWSSYQNCQRFALFVGDTRRACNLLVYLGGDFQFPVSRLVLVSVHFTSRHLP